MRREDPRAGGTLKVQVTGKGGVPAGATAVVANVTVTGATAQSFLTAYPDGTTRPLASNLNFTASQTVPNLVTVPLSSAGAIDLYNASGTVNALVDVDGYYGPARGSGLQPRSPRPGSVTPGPATPPSAPAQTLTSGGSPQGPGDRHGRGALPVHRGGRQRDGHRGHRPELPDRLPGRRPRRPPPPTSTSPPASPCPTG